MSGGDTERLLAMGAGGGGAWIPPSAEALASALPGLRVTALAGRGGMGAVYRAEQTRLGRVVAVKLQAPGVTADPLARERFEREARVLAELRHPHVVQVFDFGALADGTLFLVTEWAEGGDLSARLATGPARIGDVVAWVGQIASALDAAHARGVVHRDLKPANVLVRGDGSLALADFGLARARGAGFTTELTLSGVVFGTFDYMAPEQMAGGGAAAEITPATDVYALGVMTYQMLTGRVPRGAFGKASSLASGVPKAVDAVIEAALANDASRRQRSAGEFARGLERAARRKAVAPRALIAAAALALACAAGWASLRGGRSVPLASEASAPVRTEAVAAVSSFAPPGPASPTEEAKEAEWRELLPAANPAAAIRGGWTRRGEAVASDASVCVLALPGDVAATGFRYDIEVEFTRMAGIHSVGVILPTSSGTGVFELDAWELGLGGLQVIDGRDMRAHGENFPARLINGERQSVLLQVRGARVTASWNGVARRSWELAGRNLSVTDLWGAGRVARPGLVSWMSPTIFHRAAWRAADAE